MGVFLDINNPSAAASTSSATGSRRRIGSLENLRCLGNLGSGGGSANRKKWQKSSENTGKKWQIFKINFEELRVFGIKNFEELHFSGSFYNDFNKFSEFVSKTSQQTVLCKNVMKS